MSRRPGRRPVAEEAADVLAGRRRAGIPELFDLIHAINPTGERVGERERAEAYALKSRLQSLLIERFGDSLAIEPGEVEAGVISLRHRTYRKDACHAVLRELSPAAQAWVRLQRDLQQAEAEDRSVPAPAATTRPARAPSPPRPAGRAGALAAAADALAGWDLDGARAWLELAMGEGPVAGDDPIAVAAARSLLALLVDQLADDDAAVALRVRLAGVQDDEVRCLLALAQARAGDTAAAARWIAGAAHDRQHEVMVTIARTAIARDEFAQAQRWLDRVPAGSAHHAAALAAAGELNTRRAAAAAPLEDRLQAALAAGDAAGIAALIGDVTAVHPASRVAAAAQAELRRMEDARTVAGLLAAVEAALAAGDPRTARAHLAHLDSFGVARADLESRVAAAMAEQSAARERSEVDRLAALLRSGLTARAVEELWLASPAARAAALAANRSEVLDVLVEFGALRGQSTCAAALAAVHAVLAAEREAGAGRCEAALALLAGHETVARTGPRGALLLDRLRAELSASRQATAVACLKAAAEAIATDAARARTLLAGLDRRALPDEVQEELADLERRLARLHEVETRWRRLAAAEAAGDWFLVRALAADLATVAAGDERVELLARRDVARQHLRDEWIGDLFEGPAAAGLPFVLEEEGDPCQWIAPGGQAVVTAELHDLWLFLRVLDLAEPARSRVATVRTPAPLHFLHLDVVGDTIAIHGLHSLRVDRHTLEVVAWREYADALRKDPGWLNPVLAPGGRYLWLRREQTNGPADMIVLDIERWTKMREVIDVDEVYPIHGTPAPVLLVNRPDGSLALFDERGRELWRAPEPRQIVGAVADPGGRGLLVFHEAPLGQASTDGGIVAVTLDAAGQWGPRCVIRGAERFGFGGAATAAAHGCTFVTVYLVGGGDTLIALEAEGDGVRELWRAPSDESMVLVHDALGQLAGIVCSGWAAPCMLDRWLPRLPPTAPRPDLPRARHLGACKWPEGALQDRLHACAAVLSLLDRSEEGPCFAAALARPLDRDTLVALYFCGQVAQLEAGPWTRLELEHPHDPVVAMLAAERLAVGSEPAAALARLAAVDRAGLDAGVAQHVAHIAAHAHLQLGQIREARREVEFGRACGNHGCDLSTLAQVSEAMLAPLAGPSDHEHGPTFDLVLLLRRGDAALARGDAAAARAELDVATLWLSAEPQALARLAQAYLDLDLTDAWLRFCKRRALAAFVAPRHRHRRMPACFGPMAWPATRLSQLLRDARDWLDDDSADGGYDDGPEARQPVPLSLAHAMLLAGGRLSSLGVVIGELLDDEAAEQLLFAHEQELRAEALTALRTLGLGNIAGLVLDPDLRIAAHFRSALHDLRGRHSSTPATALLVTDAVIRRLLLERPSVLDAFNLFHGAARMMGHLTAVVLRPGGAHLHAVRLTE